MEIVRPHGHSVRAILHVIGGVFIVACFVPAPALASCDATLDAVSMSACFDHEDRERMNSSYDRIQQSINESAQNIDDSLSSMFDSEPFALPQNSWFAESESFWDKFQREQAEREVEIAHRNEIKEKMRADAATPAGIASCFPLIDMYAQQGQRDDPSAQLDVFGCVAAHAPDLASFPDLPTREAYSWQYLQYYMQIAGDGLPTDIRDYINNIINDYYRISAAVGADAYSAIHREEQRLTEDARRAEEEKQRKIDEEQRRLAAIADEQGEVESLSDYSEGLARVCFRARGCGFVDARGEPVIAPRHEHVGEAFVNGLVSTEIVQGHTHRMGFMDTHGQLVIPAVFASTDTRFSEGLAAVVFPPDANGNSRGAGWIDTKGVAVIPPRPAWRLAGNFRQGIAPVFDATLDHFVWINRQGQLAIPAEKTPYAYVRVRPQGYEVCVDSPEEGAVTPTCGFMDFTGKLLLPAEYPGARYAGEGVFILPIGKRDGPCRYATSQGKDAFKDRPIFSACTGFVGERALARRVGDAYLTVIDTKGRTPKNSLVVSLTDCDGPDINGYLRCENVDADGFRRAALLKRATDDKGPVFTRVAASDAKPSLSGYWFLSGSWGESEKNYGLDYGIAAIDPKTGDVTGRIPSTWTRLAMTTEDIIETARAIRKERGTRAEADFYMTWEGRDDPRILSKAGRATMRAGNDVEQPWLTNYYYGRSDSDFLRAANQGYPEAQYFRGKALIKEKDKKMRREGLALLQVSARGGDTAAMYKLAELYLLHDSDLVDYDEKQSTAWYRKGADAGDSDCMTELAKAYREGRGVPRDDSEAQRWDAAAKTAE